MGAEHICLIQSLICTCKLHDIDPNVYLTDVLQRVSQQSSQRGRRLNTKAKEIPVCR
ncbi:transposase domain-containing protein [Marinomonas profundi]|uniref:transposase domain-containing protein n=1 Tax=Marinomonas profundi TaxID=2726122 RepID=UPI001D10FBBB